MDKQRLAGKLQTKREELGLTQAELARLVGVSQPQITRWERAQALPRYQNLTALADALHLDPAVLSSWVIDASQKELAEVRRDRDLLAEKMFEFMTRANVLLDRMNEALDEADRRSARGGSSSPLPPRAATKN